MHSTNRINCHQEIVRVCKRFETDLLARRSREFRRIPIFLRSQNIWQTHLDILKKKKIINPQVVTKYLYEKMR